ISRAARRRCGSRLGRHRPRRSRGGACRADRRSAGALSHRCDDGRSARGPAAGSRRRRARRGRPWRRATRRRRRSRSRRHSRSRTAWRGVGRDRPRARREPLHDPRRAAGVCRVKVGLLSDIHANLVALESVLAEMGAVDELWVCGDTVGYGPDPSDVLALLVERKATIVAGNHDRAVAAGEDLDFFNPPAAVAAKMHQAWLTSAERDLLAGLPRTLETGGGTVCHGSLRDPLWGLVTTPRTAADALAVARTAP